MGINAEKRIFEKYGLTLESIIKQMYYEDKKGLNKIAKELGLSLGCMSNKFRDYKIKKYPKGYLHKGWSPTEEQREKISRAHKGKTISEEHKKILSAARTGEDRVLKYETFTGRKERVDGYIAIRNPKHPNSGKYGYMMEHKLVMEKHLCRFLIDNETVHHINKNRSDNRIENLHLFKTGRDHSYFHMKERHGKLVELAYEYKGKGSWRK